MNTIHIRGVCCGEKEGIKLKGFLIIHKMLSSFHAALRSISPENETVLQNIVVNARTGVVLQLFYPEFLFGIITSPDRFRLSPITSYTNQLVQFFLDWLLYRRRTRSKGRRKESFFITTLPQYRSWSWLLSQ